MVYNEISGADSHEIPQKCSSLPPLGAIFLSAPPLILNPGSAPGFDGRYRAENSLGSQISMSEIIFFNT